MTKTKTGRTIATNQEHVGESYTITDKNNNFVAKTYSHNEALLIVAGPDLLVAAKDMLAAIDDFLHVDENGDNTGDLNGVSNQLPNLRAAIAKAEAR